MGNGAVANTAQVDTSDRASMKARGLAALSSPAGITACVLIAMPFLLLFFRWFEIQHRLSWAYKEDWGHAYLVPLISGYILWQRRTELAAAKPRIFWPGLPAVLLGIVSYALFALSPALNFHMGQGIAIVLTVFGVVLFLGGPEVMRWVFLPIAFLAFGVTVSESIMQKLTFALQLIASEGSHVMLSVIGLFAGFQTEIQGNTLEVIRGSEVFPLNVAEACSGMRMVVAFYALSFAVAVVGCRMWWQRIATLLLAGPVALLMNMVRVTTLGVLTLIDPNLAAGEAHTVIGTVLLVPSLAAFLGIVWVLNRLVADEVTDAQAKMKATVAVKKTRTTSPSGGKKPAAAGKPGVRRRSPTAGSGGAGASGGAGGAGSGSDSGGGS